jgi:hypothetical protein
MTTPTKTTKGTRRRPGRPVPRPGPRPAAGFDVDPAEPGHQPELPADGAQQAPERPKRASRTRRTPGAPATAQRRTQGAGTRTGKAAASGALDKRLNLIVTSAQRRWLALARVDDDIDSNSRIRAMIQLWHADKELRERVDQLAAEMRS